MKRRNLGDFLPCAVSCFDLEAWLPLRDSAKWLCYMRNSTFSYRMLVSAFSVLRELPLPGVCDLAGERRKEGWICWRFPVLPQVLVHTAVLALHLLLQQCQKQGPEIKTRTMVSYHIKHISHQWKSRLLFSRSVAFSKEA